MVQTRNPPVLPRRAIIAAGLAGLTGGSAVALAMLGGVDRPDIAIFQFSRGLSFAGDDEDRLRGFLSKSLTDRRIKISIIGHTGNTGSSDANQLLSDQRAALGARVAENLGIEADRITARGMGGTAPLAKRQDESDRAYQSRLARLEIVLQVAR